MTRTEQFIKNLKRFRLVTFDVTDTLLTFKVSPGMQYAKTAEDLGITDIDSVKLGQCFRQEFKTMNKQYPNFGCLTTGMTWHTWWVELVKRTFHCVDDQIPAEKLYEIAETLSKQYRTRECWQDIKGNRELLDKVRDTVERVGVISNFDPSLVQVLREMSIKEKFDFILTSYDMRVQKPDEKIFRIPLDKYNIKPKEALHIGNMYEIDYIGARKSGWSSLLISKSADEAPDAHKSHVYNSLPDLLNALETKDIHWDHNLNDCK